MSKRDRRVATRTAAAATPVSGRPGQPVPPADADTPPMHAGCTEPAPEPAEADAPLAKVIPLGVFDPFTEADKRW